MGDGGSIRTQGSFNAPTAHGLEPDESKLYKIACAQVLPSEDGFEGKSGLDKLEAYAKEAAAKGADVILFPEYFLTGATHERWHAVRKMSGDKEPTHPDTDAEHFLSIIANIAQKNDIDIVAGTVVELGKHHVPHRIEEETDGDESKDHNSKLFNTAYYINREGKIAGRYTKRNLWHPEKATLSAGHELIHEAPSTFEITTKRGATLRAGMRICWDLAFPETFRDMFNLQPQEQTLMGPDIVFAPICWYATDGGKRGIRWNRDCEAFLLDSTCITRAVESECIIAMTNVAGPTTSTKPVHEWTADDAIAVGRSCVCAPFVGCVGRIEDGDEGMLFSCIDLRTLDDAREVYKCRQDIKNALCAQAKSKPQASA